MDTSALVKLYVREPGTDEMLALADPELGHKLTLLSIAPVEFRSALRRQRMNDIADDDAEQIVQAFSVDLESRFLRQPLTEAVIEIALGLVDRHALRAHDAMQLAGCITLHVSGQVEPILVCAASSLEKSARLEGLTTMIPGF